MDSILEIPEIYAFCDGAASGNGRSHAKASYGAVIKLITFDKQTTLAYLNGLVEPKEYEFTNKDNILEGVSSMTKSSQPSNNRGEYLGFINCLVTILRLFPSLKGRPSVTIVSDSMLIINTLNVWLPSRRAKGTQNELKNLDLVFIAEHLLNTLKEITHVTLKHVRSHKKEPTEKYGYTYINWKGNDIADRLATKALKSASVYVEGVALTDTELDTAIAA